MRRSEGAQAAHEARRMEELPRLVIYIKTMDVMVEHRSGCNIPVQKSSGCNHIAVGVSCIVPNEVLLKCHLKFQCSAPGCNTYVTSFDINSSPPIDYPPQTLLLSVRNHPGALRLWIRDPRRCILPLPKTLLLLAMLSIPRSKLLHPHHHWSMVTHIDLSKPHKHLVMSLYSHCVPLLPSSPSPHLLTSCVSIWFVSYAPRCAIAVATPKVVYLLSHLLLPHFCCSSSPWRFPARDSEVCDENERQMCFGASV